MIYRQQGQTTAVILETRGRHGLRPLEAWEQASPVAPVISQVGQKRGHCNQAPPIVALTPLGIPLPCCCQCQMLQAATTNAWSLSRPRTLQLGAACVMPPVWAKQNRELLAWSVISDPRAGCGPPPLGVCEQVALVAPVTSEERRALRPNTTHCCSPFPRNSHALLLALPNALGTT